MAKFPSLTLAWKVPAAIVAVAMLVGAGIGLAAYMIAAQTAGDLTFQRIGALAQDRSAILQQYFDSSKQAVLVAAQSETVQNALSEFQFRWTDLGADAPGQLQKDYIAANPHPAGERQLLVQGARETSYDAAHARFHGRLVALQQMAGYSDVYLFDAKGNLVYSVFKHADFAATFAPGGTLATTPLASAFNAAWAIENTNEIAFTDISTYEVTGLPSSFMAAPVFEDDYKIGVIAVGMPVAQIGEMVNAQAGLGTTGEVLIVGADHKVRNDSRFSEEIDVLTANFPSGVVDQAIGGVQARERTNTYRGTDMFIEAVPLSFAGVNWAIVTAIGADEALQPVTMMGNTILIAAVVLLALAIGIAFLFARAVTKPIGTLTTTMGEIADGKLDLGVPGAHRSDELGKMARAVEVFRENALRVNRMTLEEREGTELRKVERAQMMHDLLVEFGQVVDGAIAGNFGKRVDANFPDQELNQLAQSVNSLLETVDRGMSETGSVLSALAQTDLTKRVEGSYEGSFAKLKADTNAVADKLADIVTQLRDTSRQLKTATGEILSGANDLSERTTKQAATIEQTSAAIEQLATTVNQNAQRAKEASTVAGGVTRTAEEGGKVMDEATHAMERITTSSSKISNIIGLIDDIAFQTNLLALNASVEAARAGEAGKGFAVVAVEVRRLAQSAAQASKEVKDLIEQSANEVKGGSRLVEEAATKLREMLQAARTSNGLMEGIAAASRDQASSIAEVSTAVRQIDEMTQHNAALVEETNAAIEQTEGQASELDRIVDVFTVADAPRAGVERVAKAAEPVRREPQPARRAAATHVREPIAAAPPSGGIKGLQQKVTQAAKSYLSRGNAALDEEWSEF